MPALSLHGKTALITGASRGLGHALALGFSQAGADLVLVARDHDRLAAVQKEIHAKNTKAACLPFDLSHVNGIGSLFDAAIAAFGKIDILVNVAGVNVRHAAIEFPLSDWNRVLTLNLTAPFILCQQFAKHRIKTGKPGKIVNIASLLSHAARPTIPAYTASKGGILMLTKALAVEWAEYGIQVNAIGPGYFKTEMTQPLYENPSFDAWVKDSTPMNRWGDPQELVGTALYLASGASDFVTGQIIYVDGGWLSAL